MKSIFQTLLIAVAIISQSCSPSKPVDYTQYVNTFIGAADNGHTFPGACVPFGMIQTSPVTGAVGWQYCAEYMNVDSIIWGFSQTHLNGTGCMDLGDILVMPVTQRSNRDDYRSSFRKETESATPGFYEVFLDDVAVKAELTATPHVAYHRYSYQPGDEVSLLIDLQHGPTWNQDQYHSRVLACEVNKVSDSVITGHLQTKLWVTRDVYFVIEFNHPFNKLEKLPLAELL